MMKNNRKNHDLSLSAWGPYSKRYAGISHIPSPQQGKRFDFCAFPSLYRRGVNLPNVMWESGYHPWDCSVDLKRYTHRHELLWKDRIFTDLSFSVQDENHVFFYCRNVNNTSERQAFVFHYMASMNFPPVRTYCREAVREAEVPEGDDIFFLDALDYHELVFHEDSPQRNLAPDGIKWGEVRDHGFTGGSGLGGSFGKSPDDKVSFKIPSSWDRNGAIFIRVRNRSASVVKLAFENAGNVELSLSPGRDWEVLSLDAFCASAGDLLTLSTGGSGELDIDGFLFCNASYRGIPEFTLQKLNPRPSLIAGPNEQSLILKYEETDCYYGIGWDIPAVIRQWECDEPDNLMRHNVHEHNDLVFQGEGDGHYTEVFSRPLYIDPSSEQLNRGMVCCGSEEAVCRKLDNFSSDTTTLSWTGFTREERSFSEENEYCFSVNRLAATALLNVVYPVRLQGSWIRHHTPGRWWDCLYTWDSGFIGLGFSALDQQRAEETLNTYLTLPGNPHAVFIHHGSPVPTQFFLYQEIFNRTNSLEILSRYYDSLLQYHRFMAGRLGSSTTASLKSGLLKTWDYFYNSGGWDDYCPQVYVRRNKLESVTAPVITTAMVIRTALILKGAAKLLDRSFDELDKDIERLTAALQDFSWDREAGYFSYVTHDKKGNPLSILRDETGSNFNAGFDGVYPVNAGICDSGQEKILCGKLFSPEHLWTDSGLTAIDQSAPYFRDDGYWNGAVWMSHQWIFWKTMLDLGKGEKAFKIAETALKLWKKEVEDTYNCFEHFITSTGKGGGWHQFGGLSSPVLNWYAAYFTEGVVSVGHDTWVLDSRFSDDMCRADVSLLSSGYRNKDRNILVGLNRNISDVRVTQDGKELSFIMRTPGTIEILVSEGKAEKYQLKIDGKNR